GAEYFPALIAAIDAAKREVWFETYIFADDIAGRAVAEALVRAAARGVTVRLLIDGWGAKLYLTPALEWFLAEGGVQLMKYRPEVAPWQFRSHRMRRLHRKLCQIDGEIAFIGGINIIDDMNTPGHKPPRVDFAVSGRGLSPRADRRRRAGRARHAAAPGAGRISTPALRVARALRPAACRRRFDPGVSLVVSACQSGGDRRQMGDGRVIEYRPLFVSD